PSCLLLEWGISARQDSLHAADRWLAPSLGRLDPALRRPGLPKRRRATTKVPWYLLRPDFHRLVIVSFQDARGGAPPPAQRACQSGPRQPAHAGSACARGAATGGDWRQPPDPKQR